MAYYDEVEKMSSMLNDICRPYVQLVNSGVYSMLGRKVSESLESMAAIRNSMLMNESLTIAINNMREMMNAWIPVTVKISESIQSMLESIRPTIKIINENMSAFQNNYASMVRGFENLGYNLSELASKAYSEEYLADTTDFITNEEIIEELQKQEDNPKGFQEKFAEWSDEKKKKYCIIIGIILFIWSNFFGPYFQDTIGKPVAAYVVSKVKEIPEAAGNVIDELKQDFQAIITEDVPYYYKVKYVDEDGIEKEGYVAKKNLKIIEDTDAEE